MAPRRQACCLSIRIGEMPFILKIETMFFRIANERIKAANVTRYKDNGQCYPSIDKWYLTMWISGKQRDFGFDTKEELDRHIKYLDKVFKVDAI